MHRAQIPTPIFEAPRRSRSEGERAFWFLLASTILNVVVWAFVASSDHLSIVPNVDTDERSGPITASLSSIHIERLRTAQRYKAPQQPQRMLPSAAQSESLAPPQPAALALPKGWTRQDFGNKAATDTALWFDWKKQSGDFVARVFLWQRKVEAPYMRHASLQDAVADVLASLRADGDTVYVSKAQAVCGGRRPGWLFSYVKPKDDPPVHLDETLLIAGDTIYRATYMRAVDQPEDMKTREALKTLCV